MRFVLPLLLFLAAPAMAEDVAIARGKALAEQNCARCHAVLPQGESPLEEAPAFRDVAVNYHIEELEDALNEGVPVDHTIMPDWQMTPEQAHALASYIMSLAPAGKLRSELEPVPQSVPQSVPQPGLAGRP